MRTHLAILAGGKSTRMGVDKRRLRHPCGTDLLTYQLGVASEFLEKDIQRLPTLDAGKIFVLGLNSWEPSAEWKSTSRHLSTVQYLPDQSIYHAEITGPLLGIVSLMDFFFKFEASSESDSQIAIWAVDMPLITREALSFIFLEFEKTNSQALSLEGEPLPCVFKVNELARTAVSNAVKSDRSLRSFLESQNAFAVSKQFVKTSVLHSISNCNSPSDWKRDTGLEVLV